jgi:hypothetical protein
LALTLKTIGILLAREQLGFNTCEPVLSPYLKHIKNRAMRDVTYSFINMLFISTGIFDDKLHPQILSIVPTANAPLNKKTK